MKKVTPPKEQDSGAIVELSVKVKGEIVSSNYELFHGQVKEALSLINYSPSTDDEFGKAEDLIKSLKAMSETVAAKRQEAMAGAVDLNKLFTGLEETITLISQARLRLERQVKERKAQKKDDVMKEALSAIDHVRRSVFWPSLEDAAKGKKTITGMETSLKATVDNINENLRNTRARLNQFAEQYGWGLIPDRADLELKFVDLETVLAARVEQKRLLDEKEAAIKARKEAEERAKLAEEEANRARVTPAHACEPLPGRGGEEVEEAPKMTAVEQFGGMASADPEEEADDEGGHFHDVGVSQHSTVPPTVPGAVADEWRVIFRPAVLEAARLIQLARERLTDEALKAKAKQFCAALNAAWNEANKKETTSEQ